MLEASREVVMFLDGSWKLEWLAMPTEIPASPELWNVGLLWMTCRPCSGKGLFTSAVSVVESPSFVVMWPLESPGSQALLGWLLGLHRPSLCFPGA